MDEFNHLVPDIRDYLDQFAIDEDEFQQAMRAKSIEDGLEHWLIPIEVGRFFFLLTRLSGAKLIYEIGSYLGYSATWFAKALPEDGTVVLTENNPNRFGQATQLLVENPMQSKMILRQCDALQDLAMADSTFDIILIDHDKPYYCDAFKVAKKKVRKGGLVIADNVLWRNRIVSAKWQQDPSTMGVIEFNKMIMTDPETISLIVPIGDGVSLSYIL